MTAEEAIKWLKDIERSFPEAYFGEWRKALRMAIQALEAQPCEDCISRQAVIKNIKGWFDKIELNPDILIDSIVTLPSVTPKYTDEEIDKAQEIEQAYVDKMVELAVEETKRPNGEWIVFRCGDTDIFKCSECGMRVINPYKYCPNCSSYNGGGEDET